ncbi:MmcQ/YjbR family DNA-binding protein [Subtercola frigoramans]|uniref:DNA-binding protein (MmcQ/YjbR family) n=1 Tax=Subtercola frigoramans TaxID=120298 RepID=A0ABS2L8M9_9MICO|nr:MmcQ/YjbR family DNA-binding protein [Subtercola frigoramans]MBM7473075.1 putative DNA-binding protein (MmcQ/YjbR family) [Subtercola frigoramans]
MEREALTELALRVAGSFPAVTRGQPFGEGTEVFKVVGKVFALVNLGDRPACLTLKCAPPHARSLVYSYESIIPGYHVNKQHWISIVASGPAPSSATLTRVPDVDTTLVEDLIGNSYDIVVSLLPRDRRPFDPSASANADARASTSTDADKGSQPR